MSDELEVLTELKEESYRKVDLVVTYHVDVKSSYRFSSASP